MKTDSKYSLLPLSPSELHRWEKLVSESDDSTVFHRLSFLTPFLERCRFFLVLLGTEVKAGVFGYESSPGVLSPHPLIIYDGVVFAKNFVRSPSNSRQNSAKFDILEMIANQLPLHFKSVGLRFQPNVIDMRPFQWFNYEGTNSAEKYQINLRYTSVLDVSRINESQDLEMNATFKGLSESRRQEVRYAMQAKTEVRLQNSFEGFLSLYSQMAGKYDAQITDTLELISSTLDSLKKEKNLQIYNADDADGNMVGSAVFAVEKNTAYYLYGATSKESRERYSGSYLLWKAFQSLSAFGVEKIDLEGVNSPQRGWFKLSFGGQLLPYYQVSLQKTGLQP